jgi:hypothetical protein
VPLRDKRLIQANPAALVSRLAVAPNVFHAWAGNGAAEEGQGWILVHHGRSRRGSLSGSPRLTAQEELCNRIV